MVIWKRSRRDFRVIKKAVWLVLQEVTEASENSEGEWGEGTSCGKDPASGVQDKCVCVCVYKQEKFVHCSLQSLLAQLFLQDSKSRKKINEIRPTAIQISSWH